MTCCARAAWRSRCATTPTNTPGTPATGRTSGCTGRCPTPPDPGPARRSTGRSTTSPTGSADWPPSFTSPEVVMPETDQPAYRRGDLSIDQHLALRTAATRLQAEFDGMFGADTIERF